jgi:energy-converting hydrogenase Eha subunit A
MKPTFNDKLIAFLTLFSGLAISVVAEYYSIMGLIAIYPAAIIPIVIMGVVLGLGKISGTVWLKQNWEWSPFFLKAYVLPAIIVLMMITSLGVFGFLSKAHSDQSLVSGDVQSKIAVYDTKIQTAKDNIEANRKALKQMDEALDAVLSRSTSETSADKVVGIRRSQQKERARLQSEIAAEQKTISAISEERAPIAAEVRKVEAEVGPIKYIAHLLYGENPDANILEKAVIWVTVLIVTVLDPLAVILLLASQYSFQRFKEQDDEFLLHNTVPVHVTDVGESPTTEELAETQAEPLVVTNSNPADNVPIVEESKEHEHTGAVTEPEIVKVTTSTIAYQIIEDVDEEVSLVEKHPYLIQPFAHFENLKPMVAQVESFREKSTPAEITEEVVQQALEETPTPAHEVKLHGNGNYVVINGQAYHKNSVPAGLASYVQNEEQKESGLWESVTGTAITQEEYAKASKDKKE